LDGDHKVKKERMLFLLEWMLKALTFTGSRNRALERDIEDFIRDLKKGS